MADNRIAYGLAKTYGIDTTGMSPKEVWDALKKEGITPENAARKKYEIDEEMDSNSIFTSPKRIIRTYEQNFGPITGVRIPPRDYGALSRTAREKYGDKKLTTFGYTSNHFIVYHYLGDGYVIPIRRIKMTDKNEGLIRKFEERFNNGNEDK